MRQRLTPIIVDAPQRSEEWYKARIGSVTASEVAKTMEYYAVTAKHLEKADGFYQMTEHEYDDEQVLVLGWLKEQYPFEYCLRAGVKLAEKSTRKSLRESTVAERITGIQADNGFINNAMRWGVIEENAAKRIYAELTGNVIKDSPFMMHPDLLCGASPDGLVIDTKTGELGTSEIKCLISANHLYKIIDTDEVPDEYIPQIQMQMWISGRDWCDFVGFDSRVTEDLRVFIKRVEYDESYVDNVLVPNIVRFLDECDRDQRRFFAVARRRREEMKAKFGAVSVPVL